MRQVETKFGSLKIDNARDAWISFVAMYYHATQKKLTIIRPYINNVNFNDNYEYIHVNL